jgi:hypothetical protein
MANEDDRRLQEAVRRLEVIANMRSTFPGQLQRSQRIISGRSLSMEQGDGMDFDDLDSPPTSPLPTKNKRSMSMEGDGMMDDDEDFSLLNASPILENSPVPTKAKIRLSRRRIMDGMMGSSGRSQRTTMHDRHSTAGRSQRLSDLGLSFRDLGMNF